MILSRQRNQSATRKQTSSDQVSCAKVETMLYWSLIILLEEKRVCVF